MAENVNGHIATARLWLLEMTRPGGKGGGYEVRAQALRWLIEQAEKASHQGYCFPSLGEACGGCHRCAKDETQAEITATKGK